MKRVMQYRIVERGALGVITDWDDCIAGITEDITWVSAGAAHIEFREINRGTCGTCGTSNVEFPVEDE